MEPPPGRSGSTAMTPKTPWEGLGDLGALAVQGVGHRGPSRYRTRLADQGQDALRSQRDLSGDHGKWGWGVLRGVGDGRRLAVVLEPHDLVSMGLWAIPNPGSGGCALGVP